MGKLSPVVGEEEELGQGNGEQEREPTVGLHYLYCNLAQARLQAH